MKRLNCIMAVFVGLDLAAMAFTKVKMPIVVFTLGIIVCCIRSQIATKKAADQYSFYMIKMLDDMIEGKEFPKNIIMNESYLSKCRTKLQQLYQIVEYERSMGAQDKEQMKGLVSDVSHQLRTPLSNMKMLYNTIKRKDISEGERVEFEKLFFQQVEKVEFLIESLIKASRVFIVMLTVVGNGFSFVFVFLGIMNFVNIISAGIQARKNEISILESIGMTRRQVLSMLIREGLGYAVISLCVMFTVGLAFTVFVVETIAGMMEYAVLTFPVLPVIVVCTAVILACLIIPMVMYRSITKEDLTERIRYE